MRTPTEVSARLLTDLRFNLVVVVDTGGSFGLVPTLVDLRQIGSIILTRATVWR